MIDTHCHLVSEYYDNLEEIILSLQSKGIEKIIINGTDIESNKEIIELTKKYHNVYGAIGFYPSEYKNVGENELKWLENNLKTAKIVAIGEIGLDYYYEKSSSLKQKVLFKKQLDLASKYNKPIIIHCRNAFLDTYNMIKEYNLVKVIHCYSGSLEMAKRFMGCNTYFGIGGIVTFKNSKNIKEVIKEIPLNRILLETDSPYLSPEPNRGKKNTPGNLKYIAEKIGELKSVNSAEIIRVTTVNAESIFDF